MRINKLIAYLGMVLLLPVFFTRVVSFTAWSVNTEIVWSPEAVVVFSVGIWFFAVPSALIRYAFLRYGEDKYYTLPFTITKKS